jgi:hypothetical protein
MIVFEKELIAIRTESPVDIETYMLKTGKTRQEAQVDIEQAKARYRRQSQKRKAVKKK